MRLFPNSGHTKPIRDGLASNASTFFGSTARGEAKEDSDVELLFDHRKGELGLHQLMDVKDPARGILGRAIDIMTRASLHPVLRKHIAATALRVF